MCLPMDERFPVRLQMEKRLRPSQMSVLPLPKLPRLHRGSLVLMQIMGLQKIPPRGRKKSKSPEKKSCFGINHTLKKTTGDEAGCATKKGLITSVNRGKAYFNSWSMDVKFEGQNVVRHMDLSTHNHGSLPSNSPTWPYVDTASLTPDHPCHASVQEEQEACDPNGTPPGSQPRMVQGSGGNLVQKGNNCTQRCAEARACALPMKKDDKKVCCHPDTTGDHLVEVNSFTKSSGRGGAGLPSEAVLNSIGGFSVSLAAPKSRPRRLSGFANYNDEVAPTACVRPPGRGTNHNRMQSRRDAIKRRYRLMAKGIPHPTPHWQTEVSFWTYDEAANAGVDSHQREFRNCNPGLYSGTA